MASIDFLEYAKGLYSKALLLLEAGQCDDFSVISGSIILVVGLEKLTKYVIFEKEPEKIFTKNGGITLDLLQKKLKIKIVKTFILFLLIKLSMRLSTYIHH